MFIFEMDAGWARNENDVKEDCINVWLTMPVGGFIAAAVLAIVFKDGVFPLANVDLRDAPQWPLPACLSTMIRLDMPHRTEFTTHFRVFVFFRSADGMSSVLVHQDIPAW